MKKKKNPYIKSESLGDSPSLRIPQTCLPSWCCCRLTPHSELPPWGLLLKCSGFRTSRRCWPLILILTQILHSQRHLSSLPRPLTLSMAWFVLVSSQHYSSTETISVCLLVYFLPLCSVTQSCLTPMDYSPPGSSVRGIFQAKLLTLSFSPCGPQCLPC